MRRSVFSGATIETLVLEVHVAKPGDSRAVVEREPVIRDAHTNLQARSESERAVDDGEVRLPPAKRSIVADRDRRVAMRGLDQRRVIQPGSELPDAATTGTASADGAAVDDEMPTAVDWICACSRPSACPLPLPWAAAGAAVRTMIMSVAAAERTSEAPAARYRADRALPFRLRRDRGRGARRGRAVGAGRRIRPDDDDLRHLGTRSDRLLGLTEAQRGSRIHGEFRAHEADRSIGKPVRAIDGMRVRVHIRAGHQHLEQFERVPMVLYLVRRGVELSKVLEAVGRLVNVTGVAGGLQLRLELRPERAVLLELLPHFRGGEVDGR